MATELVLQRWDQGEARSRSRGCTGRGSDRRMTRAALGGDGVVTVLYYRARIHASSSVDSNVQARGASRRPRPATTRKGANKAGWERGRRKKKLEEYDGHAVQVQRIWKAWLSDWIAEDRCVIPATAGASEFDRTVGGGLRRLITEPYFSGTETEPSCRPIARPAANHRDNALTAKAQASRRWCLTSTSEQSISPVFANRSSPRNSGRCFDGRGHMGRGLMQIVVTAGKITGIETRGRC